jgi:phage baseplate assembly protein W
MLPEYGCQLHRLAFAPNDDTTAGLAIHYVTQAITRWEPRVDLVRVDATTHEETPGRVDVWVEYRVRTSQQADQLAVTLDLVGPNR